MPSKDYSIIACLISHAYANPEKTAFSILQNGEDVEREVSYIELLTRVRSLAFEMRQRGLEGKRALLIYQHIPEFIVSFLACLYAGVIAVPVSYVKGSKQLMRLTAIISDARASVILCSGQSLSHLQQGLQSWLSANQLLIFPTDSTISPHPDPDISPAYSAIAFIQYTSGSTGNPKGVVITGKNLVHNQALISRTFHCNSESVIFSWLPFHHDMGLIGNILHAIYTGCTAILMSPFHFMQRPQRWIEGISRYKVTHSGGPNFAYDLCVDKYPLEELPGINLSTWRVAYNGSEPVRPQTMQRFADRFRCAGFYSRTFYPCYGLAEATLLVAGYKEQEDPVTLSVRQDIIQYPRVDLLQADDQRSELLASSGKIVPGMEVRIFSLQDHTECGELQEGEICISGDSVTEGYWQKDDPALFHHIGQISYLRTGDLGFFHKGHLYVHGRRKDMMILRGKNLYPYDIESFVSEGQPAIETNGVSMFCINEELSQFVLVAEIKRTYLRECKPDNIIYAIADQVNGNFGISLFDVVLTSPLSIPRTTSGKMQRILCKDKYLCNEFTIVGAMSRLQKSGNGPSGNTVSPDAVIERGDRSIIKDYLLQIIASRTNFHQHIAINDDIELSDLGIDSLRGTELINIINKELHLHLDVSRILRENSFNALVSTIENALWLKKPQTSGKEIKI